MKLAMKITPPRDCVKCGHEGMFDGPRYEENTGFGRDGKMHGIGYLVWTCRGCGFTRGSRTLDQLGDREIDPNTGDPI